MAIVTQRNVTTTVTYHGTTYSRSTKVEENVKSKVSGQVLTFPNGYKFRKATSYSRGSTFLTFGNAELTRWKVGAGTDQISMSNGGFKPDIIYSNMNIISGTFGAVPTGAGTVPVNTSMRNEAVTKALVNIADQKVNLGENLATLGQTVRLFSETAHTLSDLFKLAFRDKALRPYLNKSVRQLERGGGVPTQIANRYLEYVYGWKPLCSDIYALQKLIQDGFGKPLLFHGKGTSNRQSQSQASNYTDFSNSTYTEFGPVTERATARCNIWAQIDPNWSGARAMNQLGLLNPLSLAWELTPWSFVVDWFLPIGSALQALSAPAGLLFVDGSISCRYAAVGPYTHRSTIPDQTKIISSTKASGTYSKDAYERTTLSNWPLPGVWFDPDPFRGDRSFKASALAISNLRGIRKSTLG